ncbi:MAG: M3 family metallopeptidase [Gammaproteobacteria bacterium]|nr:M3 family metallopeptidase [Gammaproteobacteria bacterium]
MRKIIALLAGTAVLASLGACSDSSKQAAEFAAAKDAPVAVQTDTANALLAPWTGPYGGVPAFDKMDLAQLKPALESAMVAHLAEIDVIANNPEPASFENTIVAMERSGQSLGRVFTFYGIWTSNLSSPEVRAVEQEMAPVLAAHMSKVRQNDKLFARIKAVYEGDELKTLSGPQQRLTWLTYDGFASQGATLQGEAKDRYAAINQRLAELETTFSNNVLADEENYVAYLTAEQLGGLSESLVAAAAAAARERGQDGKFAITNTRSSMDPFLTYSTERELREAVWRTFYSRGDNADAYDNNVIISEMLKLRDERVGLLGYDNYAQWQLQNRMAKTPERAMGLLMQMWPAAVARVKLEVADMQAIADAEGAKLKIAPWDYRYYAEKVRKARYDLDSDEVKQYLQAGKLREALFYVAGELFNFKFTQITDGSVPVYHPDMTVWEVTDRTSGKLVGLWYQDPYARAGKRSGAWANAYREHDMLDGEHTVLASNNSNFIQGAPGEPVLLSWDDAETLFHEFGHALQALSSESVYPGLSGSVWDVVEFQSQLLERWLSTDAVTGKFLVHYKTGKPIPAELVAKIKKAATFNSGYSTAEYLASALVDLKYHTTDPTDIDPDAFERTALAELGMPEELVMRHRSPQFTHVFSGEAYSAGYYSYMWAEVLTADAAEAFAEAPGGFYDKELSGKLVKYLFAAQNSLDPDEAYRAFRGRDATIEALQRDRGFPVTSK